MDMRISNCRFPIAGAAFGTLALGIAAFVFISSGGHSTGSVVEGKTRLADGVEDINERREAPRCPEKGPWADPDCPEAAWARSVVERAGYENDGDTGSALKVSNVGRSLYLWTTKGKSHVGIKEANGKAFARRGVIRGIHVYGGQTRWVWEVQQLHVWAESRTKSDLRLEVLRPLVRASAEIPFRG